MTWTAEVQWLDPRSVRYRLFEHGRPLRVADAIAGWRRPAQADAFSALLAQAPFPAFFWELPPLTAADRERPFEYVLVDSPALARVAIPEPDVFAAHFQPGAGAIRFDNLGGDATLVAPCPHRGPSPAVFIHLAVFVRQAPAESRHALWALLADTLEQRLGPQPLWLSTSGLGVAWLHLRLDRRPKYYQHAPYRQFPTGG